MQCATPTLILKNCLLTRGTTPPNDPYWTAGYHYCSLSVVYCQRRSGRTTDESPWPQSPSAEHLPPPVCPEQEGREYKHLW